MAWHDPSACTSAGSVRGLWGAHARPPEGSFLRLARSDEVRHRNAQGASDRGYDRFWVAIREGTVPRPVEERSAPRKYCRGSTYNVTALWSGVPINGESWQCFGEQRL